MLFVGIGAVCSRKQEGRDPFGSPTVPQQSPALSGGAHLPAVTIITAEVGGQVWRISLNVEVLFSSQQGKVCSQGRALL